jgi:O-antigen ligase
MTKEEALAHGGVSFGTNLHNAHLQLLVDLGLIGVALFWAWCGTVMRGGWRLLFGPRTPRSALTVVIFASVVAMMADTMVHGWVFSTGSPSTLVFWGFCAMVLHEVQRAEREQSVSWQGAFAPPPEAAGAGPPQALAPA